MPKLVDACEYEEARNIALTLYVLPVRLGTLNSASNVTCTRGLQSQSQNHTQV